MLMRRPPAMTSTEVMRVPVFKVGPQTYQQVGIHPKQSDLMLLVLELERRRPPT